MVARTLKHLGMAAITLVAAACSDGLEPSGGKDKKPEDKSLGGVQQATADAGVDEAQLTAFTATLHPLLTTHCGACHNTIASPAFAVPDASAALKTITTAQLVNLDTPTSSRLVKRLTEQAHNCWGDCKANGTEFSDAIAAWATKAGAAATSTDYIKLPGQTIATPGDVYLRGGLNKSWVLAAAYTDGYGDLLAPLDDAKASQRKVLYRIPEFDGNAPAQGGAHYYLEIPNSDTEKYQLCFRVKTNITVPNIATPVNYGTTVYLTVNGVGSFRAQDLNGQGVSSGDPAFTNPTTGVGVNYMWMPVFYAPDANNVQVPTAINLKPMKGSTKMDLYIRDSLPAIDLISLSGTSSVCSATAVPNTGRVYGFEFDLSEALGKPAKFTLQYQKTPDGKAQVFNRPTIETADPTLKVHVEGVYVVVNDTLDKQLSTFASVNTDLGPGGGVLSSADLIVPFGGADDKVGVYITKLSIIP